MRRLARRLRARAGLGIGFALLGMAIACATRVPDWLPYLNEFSLREASPGWWKELPVLFAGAVLVIATLRAFMERASELTQRPRRFIALLLLGITLATLCMHLIMPLLKHGRLVLPSSAEAINTWWQALLWGGLVGWLYLLNLQLIEDQEQLDALQLRRALLARELARARLGTARAQVDPAMVARILREVHLRYRERPDEATLLLDRLISYLRLAMQRGQQAAPAIPAETELRQAMDALLEATIAD
jgi:hypothetical protein